MPERAVQHRRLLRGGVGPHLYAPRMFEYSHRITINNEERKKGRRDGYERFAFGAAPD